MVTLDNLKDYYSRINKKSQEIAGDGVDPSIYKFQNFRGFRFCNSIDKLKLHFLSRLSAKVDTSRHVKLPKNLPKLSTIVSEIRSGLRFSLFRINSTLKYFPEGEMWTEEEKELLKQITDNLTKLIDRERFNNSTVQIINKFNIPL